MNQVIAVVSDFEDDYYHGVMKGVISHSGPVTFVDLPIRHNQNIINTAWILLNSVPYFPDDTIFLIVVDPGVGSNRKVIAVETENNWFVLPDNGIITPFIEDIVNIYNIPTKNSKSNTFHGRDVFAPAVRDIIEKQKFQTKIEVEDLQTIDNDVQLQEKQGMVVDIDSFGNIITNIKLDEKLDDLFLDVDGKGMKLRYVERFDQLMPGELGVLTGSCNSLEIVSNQSSAFKVIHNIRIGSNVQLL